MEYSILYSSFRINLIVVKLRSLVGRIWISRLHHFRAYFFLNWANRFLNNYRCFLCTLLFYNFNIAHGLFFTNCVLFLLIFIKFSLKISIDRVINNHLPNLMLYYIKILFINQLNALLLIQPHSNVQYTLTQLSSL